MNLFYIVSLTHQGYNVVRKRTAMLFVEAQYTTIHVCSHILMLSTMYKIYLTSVLLISSILLSGCGGTPFWLPKAHKIDIQQGNLISKEVIDSLKLGMSRDEVTQLLGQPVLDNRLNANRWDYLYTRGEAGAHVKAETLTVIFEENIVSTIENNYAYDANK